MSFLDVVPVNDNVIITIGPGLFMKEACSVHELVLDDALKHAADGQTGGQVHGLSAPVLTSDVRAASFSIDNVQIISPFSTPWDKLNARLRSHLHFTLQILHRRENFVFEQKEKSIVDFVGNDSVFPNSRTVGNCIPIHVGNDVSFDVVFALIFFQFVLPNSFLLPFERLESRAANRKQQREEHQMR